MHFNMVFSLKLQICESTVHRVDLLAGCEPDEAVAPVSQKCRSAHKGAAFTIHHKKSATLVFFGSEAKQNKSKQKSFRLKAKRGIFCCFESKRNSNKSVTK